MMHELVEVRGVNSTRPMPPQDDLRAIASAVSDMVQINECYYPAGFQHDIGQGILDILK